MSIERIIPIRGVNDDGKGKKYALHKLISASSADYVWLTDDDVAFPKAQMTDAEAFLCAHDMPDLVILPLRMTDGTGSLLCRLQQAEYAAIQQLTIETALRGKAVMCSGANLLVNRQRWLESYADLHPDLPSGDDMFLLESFKRRNLRIVVWDEPIADAFIEPQPTMNLLFTQRMRWAGKAPHYVDRDIWLCGILVALANLLQVLCPAVLLIKFPLEYTLIKKRDSQVSLWVALLLEVLYPWYMLICLLGGLCRQSRSATF